MVDTDRVGAVMVGVAAAFATALVVIRWLLRYVAHHDCRWFALYRIVAGFVILALTAN